MVGLALDQSGPNSKPLREGGTMEQNEDLLQWKENNQSRLPQTLSASEGVQSQKRDKKTPTLSGISPGPFVSYSTLTCQSV